MTIAVYITSYNQKAFLKEAIESVLNQERAADEIIIVDDGSTDGSQELITDYASKHDNIKIAFNEVNKGVSESRIRALSMVESDFVTYVDGDDLFLPNKLRVESELIKNSQCDLVFSNNSYVAEDDPSEIKWTWLEDNLQVDQETNWFLKVLTRNFPRASLFRMELVRYSLLKQAGFHDTNLAIYEDYDLRIRLAAKARITFSNEITAKVRISSDGLSKRDYKEHLKALKYIYKKYQPQLTQLGPDIKDQVNKKLDAILKGIKAKHHVNLSSRLRNKVIRKFK
jgi:glycosyltransferase involved in cell wall biosynthesis